MGLWSFADYCFLRNETAVEPGQFYLVSEYVEDGSLESLVGRLSWAQVRKNPYRFARSQREFTPEALSILT